MGSSIPLAAADLHRDHVRQVPKERITYLSHAKGWAASK